MRNHKLKDRQDNSQRTNNDLQDTTQNNNDLATRTPLKCIQDKVIE